MSTTGFHPATHGFHFDNSFVNVVLKLPTGDIKTGGRCGGMAFAALDCYFANVPIPGAAPSDFPGTGVPPDGDPLADYIYRRLFDSFWLNGPAFIGWTMASDHQTVFRGPGVVRTTKLVEIPKLCALIDGGAPVALGLIAAGPDDFLLTQIHTNHQVVAYGYDLDPVTDTISIDVYDNRFPDVGTVLSTVMSDMGSKITDSSGSPPWRGFFVENYSFVYPGPLITIQDGWRWCSTCSGLFWPDGQPAAGACPGGGAHHGASSGSYALVHNNSAFNGQHDWRWCASCSGLFWAGHSPTSGSCPAGGQHVVGISGNYSLVIDQPAAAGQPDWRWCHRCSGLFFAGGQGGAGRCPVGQQHVTGASSYTLDHH